MMDKKKINVPSVKLHAEPLHRDEVEKNIKERVGRINNEFVDGFKFIKKHPKSVSVFGSARFGEGSELYERARSLAKAIVEELKYDVITGGGPGIMEGANRGAKEAAGKGHSLGLNIELPFEQVLNPYVEESLSFYYFFSRKVILTFSAEAYIYFPGGLGTLDEFFEILTLVQTRKIPRVPIILIGNKYWGRIDKVLREMLFKEYDAIDEEDLALYRIVETNDEVIDIIKNAPIREE